MNSLLRIVAEAYSLELENRREAEFLGRLPEWFVSSHKKCLISGILHQREYFSHPSLKTSVVRHRTAARGRLDKFCTTYCLRILEKNG